MPFINLKIVRQQVTDDQKQMLIDGMMEIVENIMGRNREFTVITINEYDERNWLIGGVPISQRQSQGVFYGEIKISEGTSSPDEKEKVLRASKKLTEKVFGSVEPANYFVINELNPDSWGFDGSSMSEKRRLMQS
jgi:4-oxalocrotonate tautomerase